MAINFVSGSAAAHDALRQFMAEKMARERQEMLDRITQEREARLGEEAESRTRVNEQNARTLEDVRQATIAEREQQVAAAKRKTFTDAHMMGDELSEDEAREFADLATPGAPVQGAQVDEQDGVPIYDVLTGRATFKGTPEQRTAQQRQQAVRSVIQSNPELAKHPGISAALQTAEAIGDYDGIYSALASMTREGSTKTLQQQANEAHAAGNMAEYNRLLGVIKATGQADDRPPTPFVLQMPGQVPMQVDRQNGGVATPLKDAQGNPLPAVQTSDQVNRNVSLQRVEPFLAGVEELSAVINTKHGPIAKAEGAWDRLQAMANMDDDVAEYVSMIRLFTPLLARAAGHTGVLTQQDYESTIQALPMPGDSQSLAQRKLRRMRNIMGGGGGESAQGAEQTPARGGGAGPAAGGGGASAGGGRRVYYDSKGNVVTR